MSNQVVNSLKKYVRSAFTMNSPLFEADGYSMVEQFLSDEDSLIKGPYLSIQLPFRQGTFKQDFFHDKESL